MTSVIDPEEIRKSPRTQEEGESNEVHCNESAAFVQRLREKELFKLPGVAESIDWTRALLALGSATLEADTVDDTLGVLLKYEDDIVRVRGDVTRDVLAEVERELAGAPGE